MDDRNLIYNPMYQYYTIVNPTEEESSDSSEEVASEDIPNNLISVNINNDLENNVFYLTFNNETQGQTDLVDSSNFSNITKNEEAQSSQLMGNGVKLITLQDGRMFMATSSNDDENLETIQPHLITSKLEKVDETNDEMQAFQTENILTDELDTQYVTIEEQNTIPPIEVFYINQNTEETNQFDETISEDDESEELKNPNRFYCHFEGCTKSYAASNHLNVHMRNHNDCKPFRCSYEGCTKQFTTNYSLKSHFRTHTGEKPYQCKECPKKFSTSGDLLKHVRVHTGEKPFACPVQGCGKNFSTSNIRKVHLRSHTGERPFACPHENCGKTFSASTNYKNHIRIHSGEKPFACPVKGCNKRFTEYSSLYKHNTVHQKFRPFSCDHCELKFKLESALNLHKKVKHNVITCQDGTQIVINYEFKATS